MTFYYFQTRRDTPRAASWEIIGIHSVIVIIEEREGPPS